MTVQIMVGDALSQLGTLPDDSVHCVVTSPPYWGLRAYQGDAGMIGLEPTFDEHLENLVAVFREVRRVLRSDGTLWLNYGDAYASGTATAASRVRPELTGGVSSWGGASAREEGRNATAHGSGLKPKDLMMMPARVAMALQADGWWLRSEIVWHKPNPMPESCTDRPTSAHEKLYLLTKSARYFYDAEAVRVPLVGPLHAPGNKKLDDSRNDHDRMEKTWGSASGANLRNVWTIATHAYSEAHFATFPPALVEPCIKAGTSGKGVCGECGAPWVREVESRREYDHTTTAEGKSKQGPYAAQTGDGAGTHDIRHGVLKVTTTTGWAPSCDHDAPTAPATCLDIFAGSGTVGLVADRLQRDAILIEISPEYGEMAQRRIEADAGGLFGPAVAAE